MNPETHDYRAALERLVHACRELETVGKLPANIVQAYFHALNVLTIYAKEAGGD